LTDRAAIARLASWDIGEDGPEKIYIRVISHPLFPEAARMLSANMLANASNNQAFDGVHKDAGRFLAGCWAVYLHSTGGLTLPRLKAICIQSGMMSAGRARAMLQYLRFLHYIEPLPPEIRGARARYAPTASLLDAWRAVLRDGLEAAGIIEPAVALVVARLHEPDVLETYMTQLGGGFLQAVMIQEDRPFIRVFVNPHAGMQLVDCLLLAGDQGDVFPPSRPVAISVSATARRLRVSRAHIRRLLEAAEKEGLLRRGADRTVTFDESLRAEIRNALALRLVGFLVCAAKSYAILPETDSQKTARCSHPAH
jgi:hypothetical protein